jgi:hypothetical protein
MWKDKSLDIFIHVSSTKHIPACKQRGGDTERITVFSGRDVSRGASRGWLQ